MESPRAEAESYFWSFREWNNWPPLPEKFLDDGKQIMDNDDLTSRVNGIPVKYLSETEAKAVLAVLIKTLNEGHFNV